MIYERRPTWYLTATLTSLLCSSLFLSFLVLHLSPFAVLSFFVFLSWFSGVAFASFLIWLNPTSVASSTRRIAACLWQRLNRTIENSCDGDSREWEKSKDGAFYQTFIVLILPRRTDSYNWATKSTYSILRRRTAWKTGRRESNERIGYVKFHFNFRLSSLPWGLVLGSFRDGDSRSRSNACTSASFGAPRDGPGGEGSSRLRPAGRGCIPMRIRRDGCRW